MPDLSDPVLNGPYDPPSRFFEIGPEGPTGEIQQGRRPSESFIPIAGVTQQKLRDRARVQSVWEPPGPPNRHEPPATRLITGVTDRAARAAPPLRRPVGGRRTRLW